MENKLIVSPAPHVLNNENTRSIMGVVLFSLFVPVSILAFVFFGPRSLVITLTSMASCVFFEWIFNLIMKRQNTIYDLSALVSGVLLAFSLPVTIPLWVVVIGAFFAMVIVKGLFGGLGQNFVNPALAARVFLALSFPAYMAVWVKPVESANLISIFGTTDQAIIDTVTTATPLAQMRLGTFDYSNLQPLIFGNTAGCIGETSALILLLAGAFLLYKKIITWHIPAAYLSTVAALCYLFPKGNDRIDYMLASLFTGGLIIGAVFMATDYSTSPISGTGKIIFGIGCGLITVLIRYFGNYPEGVSFAILTMNLFTWFIDTRLPKKRYGRNTKPFADAKE